jgi:hypothetical protein
LACSVTGAHVIYLNAHSIATGDAGERCLFEKFKACGKQTVVVFILFRPHVQASLFKLYELTAIASAAVGEPEPQLVELLAALAGEVAPGSSEHLFWAQQYR